MEFYGYKKCSTCRDAHKFLEQHGIEVEFVDFVEQPPSPAQLKSWIAKGGGDVQPFVNAKGTRYRELGLKDKQFSEDEWVEMMSQDGKLLKRPLLVMGNDVIVGFNKFNKPAYQSVLENRRQS